MLTYDKIITYYGYRIALQMPSRLEATLLAITRYCRGDKISQLEQRLAETSGHKCENHHGWVVQNSKGFFLLVFTDWTLHEWALPTSYKP